MEKINLISEIKTVRNERLEAGEPVATSWLVEAVVSKHQDIKGVDADWAFHCIYEAVTYNVNKCLREDKLTPEDELEPSQKDLFPGYNRLQRRYVVPRDEEQTWVPINKLTPPERTEIPKRLRKMGQGCFEHADEFERYFATNHDIEIAS